jgi:NAD(P)-dependent dehydrogenase (short-subunit alcohol dehydrogenase family)
MQVQAPFLLTQAAVPYLERGGGSIINLSSGRYQVCQRSLVALTVLLIIIAVAAQRPMPSLGAYCVSKAAVDMLTKVSGEPAAMSIFNDSTSVSTISIA